MRDDDPDYPAIAIGGYMLGGGFLNAQRLGEREAWGQATGQATVDAA